MKEFNTTAVCIPAKHYMVDITERVKEIKKLIDAGKYFTINRARQYGKTTTLKALQQALESEYQVLSLSFEGISNAGYQTEGEFVQTFARILLDRYEFFGLQIPEKILHALHQLCKSEPESIKMDELYRTFRRWIVQTEKPIVLMIDEVDSASNNQVFLDFLALLREGYISRDTAGAPAFQSVVLAGVTDIRYIKNKIRDDGQHRQNSPWNIAADFNIDMSLSEEGIKGMLEEYETDHHTGMDTAEMAKQVRAYTNGYPFLVSRLCQLMDTEVCRKLGTLQAAWTRRGLDEAVKLILTEDNTLFQSLMGKLNNFPELKAALRSILMEGERISYNSDQPDIAQMAMYGFIRNENNAVRIANRIFETRLYNYFLSDEEMKKSAFYREGSLAENLFVKDGRLDMRLILERFIVTYTQVCGPLQDKFKEKDGRELFLLYLRPIINGTGNYYIEAQTRNQTRTDVIVDYLGQQYIVELKIWRGDRYNADGERQVMEYLDYWNLDTGYMLSFNFNKKKEIGVKRVEIGNKVLFEGTV
ncbi:MAG: AAA-like domain-containing protein [Acidaminococcaceae bacterium]|nr:AAA-like domain-containing protein [Acidaminococcaceae bacterium]